MKKIVTTLLALCLAATTFAALANAGSLLTEPFSYSDGDLTLASAGLWATHSGTGTDIQVVSGIASGSMTQAPDDNRLLSGAPTATDKTYACFLVRIPAPSVTLVCNYFAHFMVNSTTFRSKVFVTPLGNSFTFGVSVTANAAGSPPAPPASPLGATWATALNYDEWYTVVIDYDAATGVSDLWVNPSDESSTRITATDAGAASGTLTAFGLRQSSTSGAAFAWDVDNISVGTTFADACTGYPTPAARSTWGRIKSMYR